MPEPNTPRRSSVEPEQKEPQPISDDLVRQVADRVYVMLTQELAIERERQRPSSMGGSREW